MKSNTQDYSSESLLSLTEYLILTRHQGQYHGPDPYVSHLYRTAEIARMLLQELGLALQQDRVRLIALLHDLLEDTSATAEELVLLGFPQELVDTLVLLWHKKGSSNSQYISDLLQDPYALLVKAADNTDNSNKHRLARLGIGDPERATRLDLKYDKARTLIIPALQLLTDADVSSTLESFRNLPLRTKQGS